MALSQQVERCLMSYTVIMTALFFSSNIALVLYFHKFGFQCVNIRQLRRANCSEELQFPSRSDHFPFLGSGDGEEKPVAHLTGSIGLKLSGETQALQWDYETGMAYSNMGYKDGHLQIPRGGLYYVYSQVTFYLSSCEELRAREPNSAILTHNVYRSSDSYPEPTPLLTATKSVCESSLGDWHVTFSQGAVFALQERDRLFVTVNKATLVEQIEQKTFFGAFML
ncbi:tumor necrosis factor ligand superfamily member 15-like [Heptranchias perlo]|uniref:tumor necrosis factor ligand superfamily member 15-like n=1 Tax=Heptranchias perlo TaxID=212740 RepID=UPI003559B822